jgi:hypothetical protein
LTHNKSEITTTTKNFLIASKNTRDYKFRFDMKEAKNDTSASGVRCSPRKTVLHSFVCVIASIHLTVASKAEEKENLLWH